MSTDSGPLAEVAVAAAILHATADLLTQLAEFFDLHPDARIALGHYLAARDEDAAEPAAEGAITVEGLTEAGQLLHGLASLEKA